MIHNTLTIDLPKEIRILEDEQLILSCYLKEISPYLRVICIVKNNDGETMHSIIYTGNLRSPINNKMINYIKNRYANIGKVLRKK